MSNNAICWSDFSIISSERDVWIDKIESGVKGVDSISFHDKKAVINIAFPYFRLYFRDVLMAISDMFPT